MQPFTDSYFDWKAFFKQKLTASGDFYLSGHRKDKKTEMEIYTSSIPGFKTSIEIGYESPKRILFLRILNPFTPGLHKLQKEYYFDKNDFYPHFNQEGRGLEFDNFNLHGMDEYLSNGFKGSETIYLRKRKPVKAILKTNSFPWTDDTLTFHFEKAISPRAEDKKLTQKDIYDQVIEIDLHEIYPGTDRS
jgi:hypothetical protein